jgi:hypothetical protein
MLASVNIDSHVPHEDASIEKRRLVLQTTLLANLGKILSKNMFKKLKRFVKTTDPSLSRIGTVTHWKQCKHWLSTRKDEMPQSAALNIQLLTRRRAKGENMLQWLRNVKSLKAELQEHRTTLPEEDYSWHFWFQLTAVERRACKDH